MRWFVALSVCLFTSTISVPAQPPGANTVKGIIFNLVKDVNTPTGSITIMDEGPDPKPTTIIVNQNTKFETLRGTKASPSSFLAEHRGDRVLIYLKPDSDPKVATKVQVLLPPLPPPPPPEAWIKRPEPERAHIHGDIVQLNKEFVTIHLHHHEPIRSVHGTVVDTSREADKYYGSLTIKSDDDKAHKYIVNRYTTFLKVKGTSYQRADFLSDFKGQIVIVYPHVNDRKIAAKVEIVVDGLAQALNRAKYQGNHHWLTFQLTKDTKIDLVRDGKKKPADVSALQMGEHLSIQSENKDPHLAKHINIILPHSLHGFVGKVTPKGIVVMVHHYGNMNHPEHDTPAFVPIAPTTTVETVIGKKHSPGSLAALKVGDKVVAFRSGVAPHPAEKIEIHMAAAKTARVKGVVANLTKDAIVLRVPHAAKDGKPASESLDAYQLQPTTKVEIHKGKQTLPASFADLKLGSEAVVQATGNQADKIEVHLAVVKLAKGGKKTGQLVSVGNGAVVVNVHPGAKKADPTKDVKETFQLNNTVFEIVKGKDHLPANIAALKPGLEVTVHYAAGAVGTIARADKIEIHYPLDAKPGKKNAQVVSLGNGLLIVNAHIGGKKDPAKDVRETYQLNNTVFELVKGKDHTPATIAALRPGLEVTIHFTPGPIGANPVATKVEIIDATKKKKK